MRVRLITYPSTDNQIARAAEIFLANGADRPEDLESQLRAEFPSVRVQPGVVDGTEWRWYVYRDGHWVNPETPNARADQ